MKIKVVFFFLFNLIVGSTLTIKRPGHCEQVSNCDECLSSAKCYGSYHTPTDTFECHPRKAEERPEFRNGTTFVLSINCCPQNLEFHPDMCGFEPMYNDSFPYLKIDWQHPLVWGTLAGIIIVVILIVSLIIYCCVKLCRCGNAAENAGIPPPISLVELVRPAEELVGGSGTRRTPKITSSIRAIARRVQGPDHTSNLNQAIRMSWRARIKTVGGADA